MELFNSLRKEPVMSAYLSLTEARNLARDIKSYELAPRFYRVGLAPVIDHVHELATSFTAISFTHAFSEFILPTLHPAWHISAKSLALTPYYSLDEINQKIITFSKSRPDTSTALNTYADILHYLDQAQAKGRHYSDSNVANFYHDNMLIDFIINPRPIMAEVLPDRADLFEHDPELNGNYYMYLEPKTVLTNIELPQASSQTVQEIATTYGVSGQIIVDFVHYLGIDKSEFGIKDSKLYLNENFQKRLDEHLKKK